MSQDSLSLPRGHCSGARTDLFPGHHQLLRDGLGQARADRPALLRPDSGSLTSHWGNLICGVVTVCSQQSRPEPQASCEEIGGLGGDYSVQGYEESSHSLSTGGSSISENPDFWESESGGQHNHQCTMQETNCLASIALLFWKCGLKPTTGGS